MSEEDRLRTVLEQVRSLLTVKFQTPHAYGYSGPVNVEPSGIVALIDAALASRPAQPPNVFEWVKVSDGMPPLDVEVLVQAPHSWGKPGYVVASKDASGILRDARNGMRIDGAVSWCHIALARPAQPQGDAAMAQVREIYRWGMNLSHCCTRKEYPNEPTYACLFCDLLDKLTAVLAPLPAPPVAGGGEGKP